MRDGPWFNNCIFKIMHATRAGSTFSIFSTFDVDASALRSCFDRHTCLSEFALSLVNCAQLSSWARTANTHGNIGCAFYASTAAQNTPEQVKEAQIQPRAARFSQEQPRSSQNHLRSKQNQPRSSQELLKSANIKPIQTVITNWPILMSRPFLPVTST